jgi:hypothetical protein
MLIPWPQRGHDDYHDDFDKNLDRSCGAVLTWGGLHSIRVGLHQPTGRENANNYKERFKLVKLSLPSCQLYQYNPLLLVIDDPHTMIIEPSILRQYELGADVSKRNPTITSSPDDRPPQT